MNSNKQKTLGKLLRVFSEMNWIQKPQELVNLKKQSFQLEIEFDGSRDKSS